MRMPRCHQADDGANCNPQATDAGPSAQDSGVEGDAIELFHDSKSATFNSVPGIAQQVIHPPRRFTDESLAHRHDAAVGDGGLLRDGVRIIIPTCGLQFRDDVLPAGIGFGEHSFCRAARDLCSLSHLECSNDLAHAHNTRFPSFEVASTAHQIVGRLRRLPWLATMAFSVPSTRGSIDHGRISGFFA